MKKSLSVSLAIVAFVLGGVVATALTRTAHSQVLPTLPASFARYQLIVPNVDNANEQYLIDTATGRVWERFGTGLKAEWQEQGPDFRKPPVVAGR